jgi:Undecaprenyl-phosphate glucose phosphotransferase
VSTQGDGLGPAGDLIDRPHDGRDIAVDSRPELPEQREPSDPVESLEVGRDRLDPAQARTVRQRKARRLVSHAFSTVDDLTIAAASIAALVVGTGVPLGEVPLGMFVPFLVGGLVLRQTMRATDVYRFDRTNRWHSQLLHVSTLVIAAGVATEVATGLLLGRRSGAVTAGWWTLGIGIALLTLHTCWWLVVRRLRRQQWLTPNMVLVGATVHAAEMITEAIDEQNINVLGIFDDRRTRLPFQVWRGVEVKGTTADLMQSELLPKVDEIVVTVDPSAVKRVKEIQNRLEVLPNRIRLLVDQDEKSDRVAALAHLAEAPLAPVGRELDDDRKALYKLVQDVVIGVPMLIVALPVIALGALAVRLDSPGPVFFKQRRHGFNNEEIMVWKFRTMRHETADARAERQVTANDDRITRVGRFLRRSSLDELPQLFNVLRGEMSLVGPRPHAVGMKTGEVQSAQLVADYAHRHKIKPGLTGWAAINGSRGPLRSQADVKRRVALDVDYIERQSFWLDLKILFLTAPRLLGDRSAIR